MKNYQIVESIISKFKEIDKRLIDDSILNALNLSYFAVNAYNYPQKKQYQGLLRAKLSSVLSSEIIYPEYYVFEDGEFSNNYDINLSLEKYYNSYNNLLTSVCKSNIDFASAIINGDDANQAYEKSVLGTKALKVFNKWDMVNSIINPKTYDIFIKDLALMDLISNYLITNNVNCSTILFSLKDYQKKCQEDKASIYKKMYDIYVSSKNTINKS